MTLAVGRAAAVVVALEALLPVGIGLSSAASRRLMGVAILGSSHRRQAAGARGGGLNHWPVAPGRAMVSSLRMCWLL